MKTIIWSTSVGLMLCLMCFTGNAGAEIKPGAITLTPTVGGYVFEGNQDIENTMTFGVSLGYYLDEHWATEAVFNYIDTKLDSSTYSVKRDTNVYLYHADVLYHFMPAKKFVPYIAAGVGGITIDTERAGDDRDFAFNYGGGVKYFIEENVAFRGDVRHIVSSGETNNNLQYTIGLTFAFGGEKTKKMPVEVPRVVKAPEKAPEKAAVVTPEPKVIVLTLEDVHFDFDKSTLTPQARTILKRNIRLLKDNPDARIIIAGYTSASGTDDYNQKLSERRAKVVKDYLVTEGVVSPERLSTIGYGEKNQAMHEAAPEQIHSEAARANMRVLFEIIVK
jgi:OOP family OmpA-OmpF porin